MEIPNNQTSQVAAQQYRMKSSIEEYEANGLNNLLMQMFKKVLPYGAIHEDDQLIYFNVAYAMAAQLYNSPKGTMKELFQRLKCCFRRANMEIVILIFLMMRFFFACG